MTTESIRDTLNMTAGTIGRDLLQSLVQEIKLLPDVWPKLPKAKQDDVIDRLRDRVENNIRMAVHMIASEGRAVADATLEQVTFKNGIKAVFNLSKSCPARHDLADSEGKLCLIVVADAGQHLGGMDEVRGEADQRAMDLGHEYDPNGDGKGMDGPADSGDVVDSQAKVIAIGDGPLEAEKLEHYEAGRQAYREGKAKESAPMVRHELVAQWTQGWEDERADDEGSAPILA